MSLFVCWVVFPLVLLALAVGCGLLVQRLAEVPLPRALLPGVGLAVVIVVAQVLTVADATAELATPVVTALAVVGVGLSLPLRWRTPNWWPIAAGAAVFAVFAAPVVLSGDPTVVGYIRLDDTASWLAITERVMEHGRSLSDLPPSTYQATLNFYIDSDYPVGVFLPLGVGQKLVGQDAAWLYQPYLTVIVAMLALALYELAGAVLRPPWARALAAFIASQPAILYGYTLWGGIKEPAAAWLMALLAALVIPALRVGAGARTLVAPAVVTAAVLGVLSYAGGVWLGPLLVVALFLGVRWGGRQLTLGRALRFVAVALPLSIPALLLLSFLSQPAASTITTQSRLANLIEPLSPLQALGIWPAYDFRLRPDDKALTYILIAVAVLAAVLGFAWAWRHRGWPLVVYIGATVFSAAAVYAVASPWVDAKALAIGAPAVMLAATLGAAALFTAGRTAAGAVVVAALAIGVAWSNALAYQGVSLAPWDRFHELEGIGHRIAGQGPTLMNEYEPFGARYFLRDADPEAASEYRRRQVPLRGGGEVEKGKSADVDRFDLNALLVYRTLVLRRSPAASRPPAPYRLIPSASGRYYEVWQRPDPTAPRVLGHLPLGGAVQAGEKTRCSQIVQLGRSAPPSTLLAAVRASPTTVVPLARSRHPLEWSPERPGDPTVLPRSSGTLRTSVDVPLGDGYGVWVGGSLHGRVQVEIDGQSTRAARGEIAHGAQYVPLGSLGLTPGAHELVLRYQGPSLHPGSGGDASPMGPLVLGRDTAAERQVFFVPASKARSLCGQRLDWVELVER